MEDYDTNEWENIIFTEKGIVIEDEEETVENEEDYEIEDWIEDNIDDIIDVFNYLKSSYYYYINLKIEDFINYLYDINSLSEDDKNTERVEINEENKLLVGYWSYIKENYEWLGVDSFISFFDFSVKYS